MANEKYKTLLEFLKKEFGSAAVAFSGGVDSTFLLAAAQDALGPRALAVIGRSPTHPRRELDAALAIAAKLGVRLEMIETDELTDPAFRANPPNRCYLCKQTMYNAVWAVAREYGIAHVLDGSNADDLGDYRPGLDALKQLKVRSPLLELGFTKQEIRQTSQQLGLPTWDKPAFACLSSRVPYGEEITHERLKRIEQAEDAVRDLGFGQVRVRDHGEVARIEVLPSVVPELTADRVREQLVDRLHDAGYNYVCLDLEGYRTGSMNETLSAEIQAAHGVKK